MSGADITIRMEGLRELEAALVDLGKATPRILAKGLRTPMEAVLADVKADCPVEHGTLRDAYQLSTKRATAARASAAETLSEVGLRIAKVKAPEDGERPRSIWHLVEFGTSHSEAQPHIRPAFDKNQGKLLADFTSITSGEIERVRARFSRKGRRW